MTCCKPKRTPSGRPPIVIVDGLDISGKSYEEARKELNKKHYDPTGFDPEKYEGPDSNWWLDQIKDYQTDEEHRPGTDYCADEMNRIERNVFELWLYVKAMAENGGFRNGDLTLADLVELFGFIPNRKESFYPEATAPASGWSEDRADGWFKNRMKLELSREALADADLENSYVDFTPAGKDPEVLQDYHRSGFTRAILDFDTGEVTLYALEKPTMDQPILFDVNVTYDVSMEDIASQSTNPVAQIMVTALQSAVSQGTITEEDILRIFKGHKPNRLTFEWIYFNELKKEDWTDLEDRWERILEFDWSLGDEARPYATGTKEQFLAAASLNMETEVVDQGMKLIVYKVDPITGQARQLPELPLSIAIRFDKTEGD